MSVYKSLEKQIADAQKRVAELKARRTKQENERYLYYGAIWSAISFMTLPMTGSGGSSLDLLQAGSHWLSIWQHGQDIMDEIVCCRRATLCRDKKWVEKYFLERETCYTVYKKTKKDKMKPDHELHCN